MKIQINEKAPISEVFRQIAEQLEKTKQVTLPPVQLTKIKRTRNRVAVSVEFMKMGLRPFVFMRFLCEKGFLIREPMPWDSRKYITVPTQKGEPYFFCDSNNGVYMEEAGYDLVEHLINSGQVPRKCKKRETV